MQSRRITFVLLQAIPGIPLCIPDHHRVAMNFGEHGRGRDRKHLPVTFDHRQLIPRDVLDAPGAVDKDEWPVGFLQAEAAYRASHSGARRPIDIQTVYLPRIYDRDCVPDVRLSRELTSIPFALVREERL